MKCPALYVLASGKSGTLYIGVTSDLVNRIWQYRNDAVEGFSQKYGVHRLVWFEKAETMEAAILREKQLKKWSRVEAATDRRGESRMAISMGSDQPIVTVIPAKAGIQFS